MKRLACLAVSCSLALSVVACAKPAEEPVAAQPEPEAVETVEEEPTDEPEAVPETEPETVGEPQEEPAPEQGPAPSTQFVSIYNDENFAQVRAAMDEGGYPAAIAFAGSLGGRTVDALLMTSYLAETYPFVRSVPAANIADCGGDEVFVIVPADDGASVAVNSTSESPAVGKVLYRSEVGEPIVVVCDGFFLGEDSTVRVTIVDSEGNVFEFAPYVTTGNVTCLDGTELLDFSVDRNGAPVCAQGYVDAILAGAPDLADEIAAGMTDDPDGWTRVEVDGETCWQLRFGTMHGDYFATERTFAVGEESMRLFEYDVAMDSWNEIPQVDETSEAGD